MGFFGIRNAINLHVFSIFKAKLPNPMNDIRRLALIAAATLVVGLIVIPVITVVLPMYDSPSNGNAALLIGGGVFAFYLARRRLAS